MIQEQGNDRVSETLDIPIDGETTSGGAEDRAVLVDFGAANNWQTCRETF